MKLLLDNNLSYRIARALSAIYEQEHEIVALRDRFPESIPDIDFIRQLDHEGSWAVLTWDLRMRTRPHERAAMDASRIVFFFLRGGWKKFNVAEITARLLLWVPKMAAQVDLADRGRFELPINSGSKLSPYRD